MYSMIAAVVVVVVKFLKAGGSYCVLLFRVWALVATLGTKASQRKEVVRGCHKLI